MPLIRTAEPEDAEDLARLCTQLGYSASAAGLLPTLHALLKEDDVAVVIAIEAGIVRGLMQVSIHRAIESGAWAEIDALVVDEARRGRGIGKSLVQHARAWAESRNLPRLRVRTNEKRAEAHVFYERLGFAAVKLQRVYDTSISAGSR